MQAILDWITAERVWLFVGLLGQVLFAARFVVQWWASERARRSVIPLMFWYFSVGGGVILLAYSLYKMDPVFIVGQGLGLVVYLRNLYLILVEHSAAGEENPAPPKAES